MMRETRPVVLLIRLGLVLGPVLIGAVLLAQMRQSPITAPAPKSAIMTAPRNARSSSDAEISMPPSAKAGLITAAAMMNPQPPDAKFTLQGIDPSRLRDTFRRGIRWMETKFDENTRKDGARLVSAAAILGYEPARALITQSFPRTPIIRSVVSAPEAVRYSLDTLFIPGTQSESNQAFLVLLASYFSGRHALKAYATDLLAALSDDRRLQTEDRLKSLLEQLAHVPGACMAIAQAAVKARMVAGPECSPSLQLEIDNFIRVTTPAGREAESRRVSLRLLESPTTDERPMVK
jgi:hypothetical protein